MREASSGWVAPRVPERISHAANRLLYPATPHLPEATFQLLSSRVPSVPQRLRLFGFKLAGKGLTWPSVIALRRRRFPSNVLCCVGSVYWYKTALLTLLSVDQSWTSPSRATIWKAVVNRSLYIHLTEVNLLTVKTILVTPKDTRNGIYVNFVIKWSYQKTYECVHGLVKRSTSQNGTGQPENAQFRNL